MRPCFPSFVSENGRFLFGKGKLSLLCPFILDTDLNRGVVIIFFFFLQNFYAETIEPTSL